MSFRKTCCVMENQDCRVCQLNQSCAYAYIFETPQTDKLNINYQSSNLPHPFVIEPPATDRRIFNPGDEINFGLVLIGRSLDYLPYFVFAFYQLGQMGLGSGKGKFHLKSVLAIDQPEGAPENQIYDDKTQMLNNDFSVWNLPDILAASEKKASESLRLNFLTPTRLIDQNQLANHLPFELLMRSILRRVSLLGRIHCGSNWDLPFNEIIEIAQNSIKIIRENFHWNDWERYSTRQKQRMKLGGIIGTVTYTGFLAPFIPFILLGEFVHLGKNTTFGLGQYRLENFQESS
ncbi:CRISPR system precrRNA processing endoribonuclease RAMP protein Cas6 [candidate division KSB1 bacterium]|nr:CRISPR system precrRNA processing endoribonuclease RAMP protein Cas6 [candidate division KSB1 bacterium]